MCSKYKLHIRFFLCNSGNDFIIDHLIIEIIFRLINEDNIIIILCQYKQYKC